MKIMQTPNDFALLITAPLTEEDFLSDLYNLNKDFVKNWAENQRLANDGNLTDKKLWEIYSSKVKDFVLRTTDEIESLGVSVVFKTKLEDLQQIFLNKKVITVEAHWFSPKLKVEDFHNLTSFVEKLFESDEAAAKALRETMFFKKINLDHLAQDNGDWKTDLVRNMNKVFSNYSSKYSKPKPILIMSDDNKIQEEIWIHLNRFVLEKTFPNEIKQRCKIEMFDGLYSMDDFQSKIPLNFNGIIDFTVCNSELVGKVVKQFRPCLVITNRFVTDLKIRLILYKGIIKMLLNGDCQSYVEATFKLRKLLLEQIGEEK